MTAQPGDPLARRLRRWVGSWHGGLSIALALLAFDASQGSACEGRPCADRPHAYRPAPRHHGYRSLPRAYRYRPAPWAYGYRNAAWVYGYTSPARAFGDPYAPWPSTSIPPTRTYLNTATPVPNASAIGLTVPVTSGPGLQESGLPPRGPSLFGPSGPPAWGYYYSASDY